jgi:undecaprenyl pyrophosphate synthase
MPNSPVARTLSTADLTTYRDASDLREPDLTIRMSREQSLSNILPWQLLHCEYRQRERRFGGLLARTKA